MIHLPSPQQRGTTPALLENLIDYAGLFPPAGLSMQAAVRNYAAYRAGPHAWMLGRFVVPLSRLDEFRAAGGSPDWPLAVLDGAIERHGDIVYREVPVESTRHQIAALGVRAKVRTGGLTPDQFPSTEILAQFITNCARARVPFKATAGLHHAIRGVYPLTYEPGAPVEIMHGLLNVLLAAELPAGDASSFNLVEILEATQVGRLNWRGPRQVLMSIGSCSFEEPVAEIQAFL